MTVLRVYDIYNIDASLITGRLNIGRLSQYPAAGYRSRLNIRPCFDILPAGYQGTTVPRLGSLPLCLPQLGYPSCQKMILKNSHNTLLFYFNINILKYQTFNVKNLQARFSLLKVCNNKQLKNVNAATIY